MSLLIADIGGTSSRWALLAADDRVAQWGALPGFNPATGDPQRFQEELRSSIATETVPEQVQQLLVYGAGCGIPERQARMREALAAIWPTAAITVENDLLGAARGLYGRQQGLVLILGTGMNAGFYDGTLLHQPMPSLGYLLGDEGSGADIGRHLLADLLYDRVPMDVREMLFPLGPALDDVLSATYRSPSPQAYLASFTAPLAAHSELPYVHDLLLARFEALALLIARFFRPEQYRDVHATGSVAFGFQDVLGACLAGHGMRLTAVQRDPLAGLVRFHRQRSA